VARGPKKGEGGRPRLYSSEVADKYGGAPRMNLRLKPEVLEWVNDNGGGHWVREMLEKMYEEAVAHASR